MMIAGVSFLEELEPLRPIVKSQLLTKVQYLKFGVCQLGLFVLFLRKTEQL